MLIVACGFEVVDFVEVVGAFDHHAASLLIREGSVASMIAEGAVGHSLLCFPACVFVRVLGNGAGDVLEDTAKSLRLVLGLPCFAVRKVYDEAGKLGAVLGDEGDCLVDCL